ncbi:hypothetical protein CRE_00485 [Caenorhabditis remanei]|uniref:C3H1-type domain-containing protein n=1 Tax=Caenorhabditis remanei TaxID=31234 RepID=E3LC95_CAERE|nr:hypothetical protein CRE_00485 [Caenorhabditis remanei]
MEFTTENYLNEFRVEACPLFKQHQCQQHRPFTCFKWHFANQRRRRPVKRSDGSFNYSPDIYCDKYDENTGICPDGDECIFLHRVSGDVERKYHLRYYKTAQCVHPTDSRGQCVKNGAHCAFAHTANDIRPPMFDQHEVGFSTVVDGEGRDKTSFVIEDPQWHSQDHVLSCYKTEQCRKPARLCRQGYACPFYHNSKDRRRPPALYKYRSTPCPAAKTIDEWLDPDICEAGDNCQYCHTRTEQQFHPEIYKSTKCNDMLEVHNEKGGTMKKHLYLQHGYCPRAVFCAFAHHDSELHAQRNPYVGSTQPSPKEQCSPSPNGFSIPTEQTRFESPINGAPSYSSVLKTRVPIKQNYATTDNIISNSYPKAPGFERSPIVGSFEYQPIGRGGDQRNRTHSLNMGHLDMLKRSMIITGGLSALDSGNPALTSHSSLCRSDSGFNVVNDTSLGTLDELSLDFLGLMKPETNSTCSMKFCLQSVTLHWTHTATPAGFLASQSRCKMIFSAIHSIQTWYVLNQIYSYIIMFQFPQDYPQDGYNDYMKPIKNEDFNNLNEKCQYLEDALKQSRQSCDMWRMRFEGECMEKNRLLNERNNLLQQIDQMKHPIPQSPFMAPMGSPLSISLPQDNYDGGIRPSASLQHSPPYNIFGNECETGAPACARCGRDRSRTGYDNQSSCPVCSN